MPGILSKLSERIIMGQATYLTERAHPQGVCRKCRETPITGVPAAGVGVNR